MTCINLNSVVYSLFKYVCKVHYQSQCICHDSGSFDQEQQHYKISKKWAHHQKHPKHVHYNVTRSFSIIFTELAPLGQFSHRVAMSICVKKMKKKIMHIFWTTKTSLRQPPFHFSLRVFEVSHYAV